MNYIALFFRCLFLAAGLTAAEGVRADGETPLRFATLGLTPYGFTDEAGQPAGYLYDVINRVLEQAGLPGSNRILSTKRLLTGLDRGQIDCSVMVLTEDNKTRYHPMAPIGLDLTLGVIARRDILLKSYEDLRGLTIAVPIGIVGRPDFDSDNSLDKLTVPDYSHSVRLFQRGRVDAMSGALDSLYFNLLQIGMKRSDVGPPYIFRRFPVWLQCGLHLPADDPRFPRLRNAVDQLRNSGEIQQIIRRYVGS